MVSAIRFRKRVAFNRCGAAERAACLQTAAVRDGCRAPQWPIRRAPGAAPVLMSASDTAMSIRPVFAASVVLAARLWLAGYIGAVCGAAGQILTTLLYRIDVGVPGFIAFSAIGFMIAPIGILAVAKLNYARTEYRFYPDRLELEQGFFIVREKTIMFRDVKELTLRRGTLQRMCGLGTIDLSTQATDVDAPSPQAAKFGFVPGATSGASVQDIPNPEQAFDTIKKMVDACRR